MMACVKLAATMDALNLPPTKSPPLTKSSSQEQLEDLSKTVIELLNARDFENPWFSQNVSPDVRVDVQGNINYGLTGFIGNYRTHARMAQDFQVFIGNVTALVDEKQGTGTAILSQYLSGFHGDDRRMAGTILMSWVYEENLRRWICRSVAMMMGTPVFLTNDVYGAP